MDTSDPAVVIARSLVSQLSKLFKHHNPELQWTKDCIPISEVRRHMLCDFGCARVTVNI